MAQYHFGSGTLITRRTDLANTQPAYLGVLKSVDIDIDRVLKKLVGQNQSPVAIASSEFNVKGKAKFAQFKMSQYNNVILGGTQTTGLLQMATNEAATIPTTPFQVTVANSATFTQDLGVFDSTTGTQLTPVASGPVTGQYSVSGSGVYTFAAADTGKGVLIFYNYTAVSGGVKTVMSNQLAGVQPSFQVNLQQSFTVGGVAKVLNMQLNSCVADKLTMSFKNQDFAENDFSFEAFADTSGNIFTLSTSE